ncbi:MAG: LysM domain-containing protein, partial [Treponema sp.]|nr:LysM domain-containing protein [Treponema sp.]
MLFKRKRIPFPIPGDARKLTEEEMILVNGGAEEKKESQESKSESVTVKSGNTLSGIVSDYNKANGTNYTVSDVAKNSGISNPDVIYPGQEIKFGSSS